MTRVGMRMGVLPAVWRGLLLGLFVAPILGSFLGLFLGACSPVDTAGMRCEDTRDCMVGGGVCTSGTCGACGQDAECEPYGRGAVCDDGACVGAGADGGPVCDPGSAGCACGEAGCEPGLACVEGTCAECPEGARSCACRLTGDACDPGLACQSRSCVPCEAGSEGCDCEDGACDGGLICAEDGHCRAPSSCARLREAGLCAEGKACALVDGAPACLDRCEEGFRLDGGACVPCDPEGCETTRCADLDCASVHRSCESSDDGADCAGCEAGYREDARGECVDARRCGGAECPEGEMPMHGSDGACECVPVPCEDGEARTAGGECVPCSIACGTVEGETGRVHPIASGRTCMCESREGYFVAPGEDGRARPCDADGDGWIGATALAAERSPDVAIASNARCIVRRAARVDLVNEYDQTLELRPCGDGLLADRAGDGAARCDDFGSLEPIVLVEPDRNDRAEELAAEGEGPLASAPAYGTGRRFRAVELNALTRACATEHADYDADGQADIAERQTHPAAAVDNGSRLDALSFFTELHTTRFVEGPGDGVLVIAERKRCAAGFPLGYGHHERGSTYWRGCHRQRDARFGRPTAPPGLDFAPFSCDASFGACEVPIPSTGRPRQECPDGGDCHATAPYHDACEPVPDWGTAWRGMHHHSQFRCVAVDGSSDAKYAASPSDLGEDGHLAFQECALDATGGFSCVPSDGPGVGWAAVRFTPHVEVPAGDVEADTAPVPEVRGCIDEASAHFDGTPWSAALCPSPDDPAVALAHDFGRIDCPCEARETRCTDGADDDCDGLVDCADPDCDTRTCGDHGRVCMGGGCGCPGGTEEVACGDGRDNDCDGAVDCDDATCGGRQCGAHGLSCIDGACRCAAAAERCNGRDDDCDGAVDEGCPNGLTASRVALAISIPGQGGARGDYFNRTCPPGQAIVGLDVRTGARAERLRPLCAPLRLEVDRSATPDHAYRMVWDRSHTLGWAGGGGGRMRRLRCDDDEVAIGLFGSASDRIHALGLLCGTVALERGGDGWGVVVRSRGRTMAFGRGGRSFSSPCHEGFFLRGLQGWTRGNEIRLGGRCTPARFTTR